MGHEKPTNFIELREQCQKQWKYASPFRMGILAGEIGYSGKHEYAGTKRALRLYQLGVEYGKASRQEGGK